MSRLVAVLVVVAAACTSAGGASDAGAVATVYPFTWLVEQIAPDMPVTSLGAKGQDPHDLELTPQQRAAVERAGLVVYLGDIGFQPQVEQAIANSSSAVVSAADVVGEEALLPAGEEGLDPHLWFDPALMADIALAVGEAAAEADDAQAETYRANAQQVAEELDVLAGTIKGLLSSCRHEQVIVGHEAFGYLLAPHGLTQRGISGAGGHSEASPQDISTLADEIRTEQLPAVLSEPVEGRTDAEAVAREAGVDVIDVLSLDIVDAEQAERGYPALLTEQAEAVATAAECGS